MSETTNDESLDSLMGRSIVEWSLCDEGMHFTLDDGRSVIFAGAFVIGIYAAEDAVVH